MPNRYSSPHIEESASVHSGSPSKSKNMSPRDGAGNARMGLGSNTSTRMSCGPPSSVPVPLDCTCSRACSRRLARVRVDMPGTLPSLLARSSIVVMPAAINLPRWIPRRPATSRRSRWFWTSASQAGHVPHAE